MTSSSKVFKSFYHASNKGRTLAGSTQGNYPCQPALTDDWSKKAGYGDSGLLIGMAQRGAGYAANNESKTYTQILNFYYPGHVIASNNNGSGSGSGSGSSSFTSWDGKYGNNTFVNSSTYSGNAFRVQRDLNRWGVSPQLSEDGLWGAKSATATTQFQNAYKSELSADGLCGPGTKKKLYDVTGKNYD